jgi:hypothetical protein
MHSRRNFLEFLATAASTGVLGSPGNAVQDEATQSVPPTIDANGLAFWTDQFLKPVSGTLSGPKNPIPSGEAQKPQFFIYTEKDGFRVPSKPPVKLEELGTIKQPNVTLRVQAFKPSDDHSDLIASSQGGTLRLDLVQPEVLESGDTHAGSKGSTAISGQAVKGSQKLDPTSLVSGLTVGQAQEITLPDGGGYLSCTFFFQKKEALWHQVLSACLKGSTVLATNFAPVLNIAAAPKKDWSAINAVMGALFPNPTPDATQKDKSTSWLFAPAFKLVAASQDAYGNPKFAAGLPLIKDAHYLLVPEGQYQDFGNVMDKMMLTPDGYVVPKSTLKTSFFAAAFGTPELKKITYLTLHCEDISAAPPPCDNKTPVKTG